LNPRSRRRRSIVRGFLFAGALAAAAPVALAAQDLLLDRYRHLLEPRITTLKAEKVLVVTAKGDPNLVGPAAFGLLFQLYFSIRETPKGPGMPVPRARWPEDLEAPKDDWVGRYAMIVPDRVSELPPHHAPEGLEASLSEWEYGEMGEILHVGRYDQEGPTVERLNEYLRASGYVTVGGHEEEYLRGPTMTGPGDPEKYLTILRYRVVKT
jgi:hypothetical protein